MNSHYADEFVALMTAKFKDASEFVSNQFRVMPGRKYDRIVADNVKGTSAHVHAFIERETGYVYKAAGWNAPAKDPRYLTVEEAAEAADLHGGYLYKR